MRALSQFDFHHRLADSQGPALVLFTSPDCGACRQAKQALAGLHPLRPDIALFEVDVQRDTALVREFEVFHLPALFLYRDGGFHCELHSEPLPEALSLAVDEALRLPAREAP